VLLCTPYPMAFTLLQVRRREAVVGTVLLALVLTAGVVPLRGAQEHLAARVWFGDHRGLPRDLLQTVDWPGGTQGPIATGPLGVQTTVLFQDTSIDGFADGVVTVSLPGTDPCGPVPAISDGEMDPDQDPDQVGEVIDSAVATCTPKGPNAWALSGADFTGYAERRDNVLLRITVDGSRRGDDDFPAIARTLHPLDAHTMWHHLSNPLNWSWLLE
jgi:hypothetical protein